jgi:VWFA-related protein
MISFSGDLPSYPRRSNQELFLSMLLQSLPMRILLFSAACWLCAAPGSAQEQGSSNQKPDVVRVNTSLVQTDVMVFNKQGGFVDGLTREQFVLKVDGRPRDISFFERIVAGSRNEEAQLAAARGNSGPGKTGAIPLDRGRTVFFFIDDIHLSAGSMKQTRLLLQRFIDREMGQNDEAAITSSSGQIGFLQQLTDDKGVLRAATERLMTKPYTAKDSDQPPISEYQAILIERSDPDVLDFFVEYLIKENPMLGRSAAEGMVRSRASRLLHQAAPITTNTLSVLKSLVDRSAALPGRKLLFLISDGFVLDPRNSDSSDRVRRITSAAAASGVVIYSIDARGLATGLPEASSSAGLDISGRLLRTTTGELTASRDVLSALASETGGLGFYNNNTLSKAVTTALKETSAYYLIAWRPENDEQGNAKSHRIEVSIDGKPNLVIRFRRAFGEVISSEAADRSKDQPTAPARKSPNEELRDALGSAYPKNELPISITLNFIDVPQYGATLTTSLKVSTSSLVLEAEGGPPQAILDVTGAIFDDQGKSVSTFNKRFTIKANPANPTPEPPESFLYNYFSIITPGLYQVRVAALDEKQGRSGSNMQWIQVPDVGSKALTLSSLIVGEKRTESENPPAEAITNEPDKQPSTFRQVSLNVDHHFARSSHLRFLTFVYNALRNSSGTAAPASAPAPSGQGSSLSGANVPPGSATVPGNAPDLAVQVQVFRDNEPVITMPLAKIQVEGASDLLRLPYGAEVSLDGLQPGRYVLLVTVIDRVAKASASQRFGFQVD